MFFKLCRTPDTFSVYFWTIHEILKGKVYSNKGTNFMTQRLPNKQRLTKLYIFKDFSLARNLIDSAFLFYLRSLDYNTTPDPPVVDHKSLAELEAG